MAAVGEPGQGATPAVERRFFFVPVAWRVWPVVVEAVAQSPFAVGAVTEPVDAQHCGGAGQLHEDLNVAAEGGTGGVGRPEEQPRPSAVLEDEDLGVQPGEGPTGIERRPAVVPGAGVVDVCEVCGAAVVEGQDPGHPRQRARRKAVERLGPADKLADRGGVHPDEEVVAHERRDDQRPLGLRRQRRGRLRQPQNVDAQVGHAVGHGKPGVSQRRRERRHPVPVIC